MWKQVQLCKRSIASLGVEQCALPVWLAQLQNPGIHRVYGLKNNRDTFHLGAQGPESACTATAWSGGEGKCGSRDNLTVLLICCDTSQGFTGLHLLPSLYTEGSSNFTNWNFLSCVLVIICALPAASASECKLLSTFCVFGGGASLENMACIHPGGSSNDKEKGRNELFVLFGNPFCFPGN